jgi:recombinational DNA repair protein RecT
MLRQLISRWGIMSIDLQMAMDKDMAAIHEDGTVEYVDNSVDYAADTISAPVTINADPATGEVIDMPQDPQEEDPTAGFFNN